MQGGLKVKLLNQTTMLNRKMDEPAGLTYWRMWSGSASVRGMSEMCEVLNASGSLFCKTTWSLCLWQKQTFSICQALQTNVMIYVYFYELIDGLNGSTHLCSSPLVRTRTDIMLNLQLGESSLHPDSNLYIKCSDRKSGIWRCGRTGLSTSVCMTMCFGEWLGGGIFFAAVSVFLAGFSSVAVCSFNFTNTFT